MNVVGHYINGHWVNTDQFEVGESYSPFDGEVCNRYSQGTVSLTEEAIGAARNAFETTNWSDNPRVRANVLNEFANRLEAIQADLATIVSRENGKLYNEAFHEIAAGFKEARYYAGLCQNIFGRVAQTGPGQYSTLSQEAIGVAAIIVPWNAPITLLIRSLAPALAAGCSVVIKPATQSALSNAKVIECFDGIEGLPDGIINSVTGDRNTVGAPLVQSADIDVISFTGSSSAGKSIMAEGAQTLKRMSLELGGKAPSIVYPDANFDTAVAQITRCALVHAGQMCVAITRVLVHKDCYKEFSKRLTEAFKNVKTGGPNDASSTMGPVIDMRNQERVLSIIEQADKEANVLVRGAPLGGDNSSGSFVTPTLFEIDDTKSSLIQEEIFGPVVSIEIFDDEEDSITKANDSKFGLAASIWTNDLALSGRVSRKLKTGTIWINSHMKLMAEIETGGYKESGLGRLHGVEGLHDFLETKHVYHETF